MSRPGVLPAVAVGLLNLGLAAPAQAVIGVYDRYFVTTEASTESPGGQRGYHWYNNRGTAINALPGAEFAGNGTYTNTGSSFDTTGRLTAATSQVATIGLAAPDLPSGDWNRSVAAADLATGGLQAAVTSVVTGGYTGGQTFAQAHDQLTFSIAGAAADTRTRITVEFIAEGTWAEAGRDIYGNGPTSNVDARLSMQNPSSAQGALNAWASAQWTVSQPATVVPTLIGTQDQFTGAGNVFNTGDVNGSGSWAGSTANRMVFVGSFDLIGASVTLNPSFSLAASCTYSTCLFTSSFRFVDLPAHVSYSSDSGVFLTAVPEPGTWALMLGGVGMLLARRRGLRTAP